MARQVQLLLNLARKPSTSPPTLLFPTFDPLPRLGHSTKRRIVPTYDPAPPRPENSTESECRRTLPASDPAPPRPENSTECWRTLPASDPAPPRPENSTECRRTLPASDPRPSPLVVLDPKSFGEAIADKILGQMKQWRKEDKDSARVNTTIAFVGFFAVVYQLWKDYSAWMEKKEEESPTLKQQSETFKMAETRKTSDGELKVFAAETDEDSESSPVKTQKTSKGFPVETQKPEEELKRFPVETQEPEEELKGAAAKIQKNLEEELKEPAAKTQKSDDELKGGSEVKTQKKKRLVVMGMIGTAVLFTILYLRKKE